MPPKNKVSAEEIISAATELVRNQGAGALNARDLAARLGCSTQPIFSNFSSMEELKIAVVKRADELCREYMRREEERGEFPLYKANGMAYIHFAREEKELFKLLYMRDRTEEQIPETDDLAEKMTSLISQNTGLDRSEAILFHLETWAFVHGIAVMLATGFLDLERELISKMLTDCFLGLKKQNEEE